MSLPAGTRLGPYEIVAPIGAGAARRAVALPAGALVFYSGNALTP